MPLPLMNHFEFVLFAQRTRIPTFTRSIGFCVIWVCISSSSSSSSFSNFDRAPEGPEFEGKQADRESKESDTMRKALSGTQARVAMEVVVTAQSGTLVHALRIMQRRKFPYESLGFGITCLISFDTGPEGPESEG